VKVAHVEIEVSSWYKRSTVSTVSSGTRFGEGTPASIKQSFIPFMLKPRLPPQHLPATDPQYLSRLIPGDRAWPSLATLRP
jgi:hypothetical protein